MTKFKRAALVAVSSAAALTAASSAHAVIDITAALAGITDAGVALLAIIGGLLAMSVLLFGIGKVYGFVKRKAGA